jgi:ribosomal protein S18 acetylase RimI-like enzyme
MHQVALTRIDSNKFPSWRVASVKRYAEANVAAGVWQEDGSMEKAEKDADKLLYQGAETPGNHIWEIEADNEVIGSVWIKVVPNEGSTNAFIYDIELSPTYQGRGFGQASMLALEEEAKRIGVRKIGLRVFSYNEAAYRLYKKVGYRETKSTESSHMMEKSLTE